MKFKKMSRCNRMYKEGGNCLGLRKLIWGIFIFDHIREKISRNSLINVRLGNISVFIMMKLSEVACMIDTKLSSVSFI